MEAGRPCGWVTIRSSNESWWWRWQKWTSIFHVSHCWFLSQKNVYHSSQSSYILFQLPNSWLHFFSSSNFGFDSTASLTPPPCLPHFPSPARQLDMSELNSAAFLTTSGYTWTPTAPLTQSRNSGTPAQAPSNLLDGLHHSADGDLHSTTGMPHMTD